MRRGRGVGDERGARHRAAVRGGDAALARLPAPRLRPPARAPRARCQASRAAVLPHVTIAYMFLNSLL